MRPRHWIWILALFAAACMVIQRVEAPAQQCTPVKDAVKKKVESVIRPCEEN